MLLKNAFIFTPSGFVHGYLRWESGIITEIGTGETADNGTDMNGLYILPGLVDIHIHGCCGHDFSDGDSTGLCAMARSLASQGVTSFVPTAMSLPESMLFKAFESANTVHSLPADDQSRLLGIRMEGPFLSKNKKGSHNGDYLRKPDTEFFEHCYEKSRFLLRALDVSPELPGAALLARRAWPYCRVSAAHTESSYEDASAFFNAGGSHVTHLFNAMGTMTARSPGVIAAAAERDKITAEIICDGIHVHPSMVRAAFKLFPGRLCLVSDALRCCGMPDGRYELSGQTVIKKNGCAYLENGTIAGAATSLWDAMKNAVSFGIPLEEAILSATLLPAKIAGAASKVGSIEEGKYADIVVCSKELTIADVFIAGRSISAPGRCS